MSPMTYHSEGGDPFPSVRASYNDYITMSEPSRVTTEQGVLEFQLHKKSRYADNAPAINPVLHSSQGPRPLSIPNPSSLPEAVSSYNHNNYYSTSTLFFKTRLCDKFKSGSCPYGNNCSFAHGPSELRMPPHNWQEIVATSEEGRLDEQQRNRKMKICRKYSSGEGCPYGDRCTYIHEERARRLYEVPERSRELSVINISTTERQVMIKSLAGNAENAGFVDCEAGGASQRGGTWKTKMCHKWEMTGACPFGEKCIFAHGQAEKKKFGGKAAAEDTRIPPSMSSANTIDDLSKTKMEPNLKQVDRKRKPLVQKDFKKIIGIYGDWINDDLLA